MVDVARGWLLAAVISRVVVKSGHREGGNDCTQWFHLGTSLQLLHTFVKSPIVQSSAVIYRLINRLFYN